MRRRYAVALCAIAFVAGFALARHPADAPLAAARQNAAKSSLPDNIGTSAASVALPPLPADLATLDGADFVRQMPELERLARNGSLAAMRVLFDRLNGCVNYVASDDDLIRANANANFERQLDVGRQIRAHIDPSKLPPSLPDEAELQARRDADIRDAFALRERCTTLSAAQVSHRFDWLLALIERRDRQSVLAATQFGGVRVADVERTRYTDMLSRLAESEGNAFNEAIATGDIEMLRRAMNAYVQTNRQLLPFDPRRAYAYAYALSLADGMASADEQRQATQTMTWLTSPGAPGALSAAAIEAARSEGRSIYRTCCAVQH